MDASDVIITAPASREMERLPADVRPAVDQLLAELPGLDVAATGTALPGTGAMGAMFRLRAGRARVLVAVDGSTVTVLGTGLRPKGSAPAVSVRRRRSGRL